MFWNHLSSPDTAKFKVNMAEELSWKYEARKGCEKTMTPGAYFLVISKWHEYHVFEQD